MYVVKRLKMCSVGPVCLFTKKASYFPNLPRTLFLSNLPDRPVTLDWVQSFQRRSWQIFWQTERPFDSESIVSIQQTNHWQYMVNRNKLEIKRDSCLPGNFQTAIQCPHDYKAQIFNWTDMDTLKNKTQGMLRTERVVNY